MSRLVARPQRPIYAAQDGEAPVLELWLTGGRGTQRLPLRVEVLGSIDDRNAWPALRAVAELMADHGPWLSLDLFGVESIDDGGRLMLQRLADTARRRGGAVSWRPRANASAASPAATGERHVDITPRPATSPPSPPPATSVVRGTTTEGPVLVVHLQGELDAWNAADLELAVRRSAQSTDGPVVLDLGDVTFVDCSVIACIIRLRRSFAEAGRTTTVRNAAANVGRVFEITDLFDLLAPFSSQPQSGPRDCATAVLL